MNRVKKIIAADPKRVIVYAMVVFCLAYLYYPTFSWMANHWESTFHYSHGSLVPVITLFLLWLKRQRLKELPKSFSMWGLVIVVGSLLFLWAAVKADVNRLSAITFITLLYGFCIYFCWKAVFKNVNHRWAYVTAPSPIVASEEESLGILEDFIRQIFPLLFG